jgi:hypothetical protein
VVVGLSPAESDERCGGKNADSRAGPEFLLRGRYIATLGTENADGTIHLITVKSKVSSILRERATPMTEQEVSTLLDIPLARLQQRIDSRFGQGLIEQVADPRWQERAKRGWRTRDQRAARPGGWCCSRSNVKRTAGQSADQGRIWGWTL